MSSDDEIIELISVSVVSKILLVSIFLFFVSVFVLNIVSEIFWVILSVDFMFVSDNWVESELLFWLVNKVLDVSKIEFDGISVALKLDIWLGIEVFYYLLKNLLIQKYHSWSFLFQL